MKMYGELASWWPIVSAPEEYDEEAMIYATAIEALTRRDVREVLELGCGGGNNATHLKARWALTLTDISEEMLAVSRAQNPECAHVHGDMRTLRLERDFDAVFVHDAVMYMTSEADLLAAMRTAGAHLRPGGVALFVPDDTAESYVPQTSWHGHDAADRSVRFLEWAHPFDASTTTCNVSFAFLLREGSAPVRCVYDEHTFGLFPRATWMRLIADAGLEPQALPYEHSTFDPKVGRELFAGVKV